MPAMLEDPSAPTIHRVSGALPYPDPDKPALPPTIHPRQVTLRDRVTVATVVPFVSRDQVPASLLRYLCDQFAKEIEGGDTYPMTDPLPFDKFSLYWLQNFAGIMLLGRIDSPDEVVEGKDWSRECLGSFYIKPNYPGRSSHVCNAGFLVTDGARNRGVGRLMGESYLDWAPKLGYTYSVFNLVYETNVASCRIWDALGFKRIGRIKGSGNLKSYPDRLVDAIIYGRDLGNDGAEGGDPQLVSEDRFDKIKFYLKHGRYPNGSDRAEKSRLRSAATHYKLLDNDVLMLKGKEVISDPFRQMAIALQTHKEGNHGGINKTTSVIAEKYHWSRIKETVSDVIKTCDQCSELVKSPSAQNQSQGQGQTHQPQAFTDIHQQFHDVNDTRHIPESSADLLDAHPPTIDQDDVAAANRILDLDHTMHETPSHHELGTHLVANPSPYAHSSDIASLLNPAYQTPASPELHAPPHLMMHGKPHPHHNSVAATLASLHSAHLYHPIDPQLISQPVHGGTHAQHASDTFSGFHTRITALPQHHHPHHHHPHHNHHPQIPGPHASLSPHSLDYSPHITHAANLPSHALHGLHVVPGHASHAHDDSESFQDLLNDPDTALTTLHSPHPQHHHHHHHAGTHHDDMSRSYLHHTTSGASATLPPRHRPPHGHDADHDREQDAVDRDMAMLIDHDHHDHHHDEHGSSLISTPTPSPPPQARTSAPKDSRTHARFRPHSLSHSRSPSPPPARSICEMDIDDLTLDPATASASASASASSSSCRRSSSIAERVDVGHGDNKGRGVTLTMNRSERGASGSGHAHDDEDGDGDGDADADADVGGQAFPSTTGGRRNRSSIYDVVFDASD